MIVCTWSEGGFNGSDNMLAGPSKKMRQSVYGLTELCHPPQPPKTLIPIAGILHLLGASSKTCLESIMRDVLQDRSRVETLTHLQDFPQFHILCIAGKDRARMNSKTQDEMDRAKSNSTVSKQRIEDTTNLKEEDQPLDDRA